MSGRKEVQGHVSVTLVPEPFSAWYIQLGIEKGHTRAASPW